MNNYQLELRQIVDYPRCRIYREFIQTLIADRSIRTGGCSGLFYYVVLCAYANFRTSYRRIDGISYTVYPGEWICSITDITEWFRVRFHYQAFAILKSLQDRQLITFTRLGRGHIVKFSIITASATVFLSVCSPLTAATSTIFPSQQISAAFRPPPTRAIWINASCRANMPAE